MPTPELVPADGDPPRRSCRCLSWLLLNAINPREADDAAHRAPVARELSIRRCHRRQRLIHQLRPRTGGNHHGARISEPVSQQDLDRARLTAIRACGSRFRKQGWWGVDPGQTRNIWNVNLQTVNRFASFYAQEFKGGGGATWNGTGNNWYLIRDVGVQPVLRGQHRLQPATELRGHRLRPGRQRSPHLQRFAHNTGSVAGADPDDRFGSHRLTPRMSAIANPRPGGTEIRTGPPDGAGQRCILGSCVGSAYGRAATIDRRLGRSS